MKCLSILAAALLTGVGEGREIEASAPLAINWRSVNRPVGGPAFAGAGGRGALVELAYDADRFACYVVMESLDDPEAAPIRACLAVKGGAWLVLAPGRWRISMRAGRAGRDALEFEPITVRVRPRTGYQLSFGEKEEGAVTQALRDRARQIPTPTPPAGRGRGR